MGCSEDQSKEKQSVKNKRKKKERKKPRKERRMEVRRVVEEWEIWKKKEKASKSKAEVKKLVPEKFHK